MKRLIKWGLATGLFLLPLTAHALNTDVQFGRGPGNPGTVCIYDYSTNRLCDPMFTVNDNTGLVTWLGAYTGTTSCPNLPAFTGDVTTTAGTCANTLATVNSNIGPSAPRL